MNVTHVALVAQQNDGGGAGQLFVLLIQLAVVVLTIAGAWKTFEKAGKPGWAAIIPIYNFIVVLEIAGKPIWWIILVFIPCVNIVIAIMVYIDFAKRYGQGAGMGLGLTFLPVIFFPVLGFGSARYTG